MKAADGPPFFLIMWLILTSTSFDAFSIIILSKPIYVLFPMVFRANTATFFVVLDSIISNS